MKITLLSLVVAQAGLAWAIRCPELEHFPDPSSPAYRMAKEACSRLNEIRSNFGAPHAVNDKEMDDRELWAPTEGSGNQPITCAEETMFFSNSGFFTTNEVTFEMPTGGTPFIFGGEWNGARVGTNGAISISGRGSAYTDGFMHLPVTSVPTLLPFNTMIDHANICTNPGEIRFCQSTQQTEEAEAEILIKVSSIIQTSDEAAATDEFPDPFEAQWAFITTYDVLPVYPTNCRRRVSVQTILATDALGRSFAVYLYGTIASVGYGAVAGWDAGGGATYFELPISSSNLDQSGFGADMIDIEDMPSNTPTPGIWVFRLDEVSFETYAPSFSPFSDDSSSYRPGPPECNESHCQLCEEKDTCEAFPDSCSWSMEYSSCMHRPTCEGDTCGAPILHCSSPVYLRGGDDRVHFVPGEGLEAFTFVGEKYDNIAIGSNGVVTLFGDDVIRGYSSLFTESEFGERLYYPINTLESGRQFIPYTLPGVGSILAFHDDINTEPYSCIDAEGRSDGGEIFYCDSRDEPHTLMLEEASKLVESEVGGFKAVWAFPVTWERVTPFNVYSNDRCNARNTFQVVLVAGEDGSSYIIFNYEHIVWGATPYEDYSSTSTSTSMYNSTSTSEWTPSDNFESSSYSGPYGPYVSDWFANAGLDAGDGVNYFSLPGSGTSAVLDLDTVESNTLQPGRYVIRVDEEILPGCHPEACENCGQKECKSLNSYCRWKKDEQRCLNTSKAEKRLAEIEEKSQMMMSKMDKLLERLDQVRTKRDDMVKKLNDMYREKQEIYLENEIHPPSINDDNDYSMNWSYEPYMYIDYYCMDRCNGGYQDDDYYGGSYSYYYDDDYYGSYSYYYDDDYYGSYSYYYDDDLTSTFEDDGYYELP